MPPKAESCRLARQHLAEVTGSSPDEWRCTTDPVTGMGEEFFFMHNADENRFVYICIEDGAVTATETS